MKGKSFHRERSSELSLDHSVSLQERKKTGQSPHTKGTTCTDVIIPRSHES